MAETGVDLLHKITLGIKEDLKADYAFIGAIDQQGELIRTVSFCSDTILDNIEYNPENTPCQDVVQMKPCIYPKEVQVLFPKDQLLADLGIHAYIGFPLMSLDRTKVIGLFGALFKREVEENDQTLKAIEFLAPRVELELDRHLLTRKLNDNKALFDAISNQTTEGITVADMKGNYLYVNQAFCKMSGYSEQELLGMTVFDMKAANQNHQSFYDSKEEYEGMAIRVNLQKKDGTEYLTEIIGDVITVDGKEQVLGTIRDISDRVKAEQRIVELNRDLEKKVTERTAELQESLNVKQVLLKEITHRVKNNLQVIASILNLQKSIVTSEESRKVCTETSNRIHSMALIHETLYKETEYSHVQFKKYTESLINYLVHVYDFSGITINEDIEDCTLSLDVGTSCGMIIIELVTNSIKYAFPNGGTGEINVSLTSNGSNEYCLKISDSGIGFPEAFNIESGTTLGTQLVASLVEQIDGKYHLENKDGASFEMRFVDED
jgi:PAS domain S-box-containing protein